MARWAYGLSVDGSKLSRQARSGVGTIIMKIDTPAENSQKANDWSTTYCIGWKDKNLVRQSDTEVVQARVDMLTEGCSSP